MTPETKYSLFLYVLECTGNRYYIGITSQYKKRINNHFNGNSKGAVFTKIYPPIKCIELFKLSTESREEAEAYETFITIEYAMKYGGHKVCGGLFCVTDNGFRKRDIDTVIEKNKIKVHGKAYELDDETMLLKIKECRSLAPENFYKENQIVPIEVLPLELRPSGFFRGKTKVMPQFGNEEQIVLLKKYNKKLEDINEEHVNYLSLFKKWGQLNKEEEKFRFSKQDMKVAYIEGMSEGRDPRLDDIQNKSEWWISHYIEQQEGVHYQNEFQKLRHPVWDGKIRKH